MVKNPIGKEKSILDAIKGPKIIEAEKKEALEKVIDQEQP